MAAFGFKPSEIDGSEYIFGVVMNGREFPDEYSYEKYLPKVLDQGDSSTCVPCSISAFLNWRENLNDGSHKDNKVDINEIYKNRTEKVDGMTFKDAFKYLRHNGVKSDSGNLMIGKYAMVRNMISLKEAIIMNGPCFGALPVYNYNDEFWIKNGSGVLGYHAIAIVGFNKDGFIIRNSWGSSYGKKGYATLKYENFNSFIEAWTVIE